MRTAIIVVLALVVFAVAFTDQSQWKFKQGTAGTTWDSLILGTQSSYNEGYVQNDAASGGGTLLFNSIKDSASSPEVRATENSGGLAFIGKYLYFRAKTGTVDYRLLFQPRVRIP